MPQREGEPALVVQLREAIRDSGQSLYRLAKSSGVGPDRLSRFMRGERDLTLAAAGRVCAALGLALVRRDRPAGKPGKK